MFNLRKNPCPLEEPSNKHKHSRRGAVREADSAKDAEDDEDKQKQSKMARTIRIDKRAYTFHSNKKLLSSNMQFRDFFLQFLSFLACLYKSNKMSWPPKTQTVLRSVGCLATKISCQIFIADIGTFCEAVLINMPAVNKAVCEKL